MNPTAPCPPADNERRTPSVVLKTARKVLHVIDLDPASDAAANERVEATRFFDRDTNGLARDWKGRVFLNPPGGKLDPTTLAPVKAGRDAVSSAAIWWAKLLHELINGRVEAAIFVCFNLEAMLNTQKFAPLPIQAFTFCVPRKRLAYPSKAGGKSSSPPGASAIVYVGDNIPTFFAHFSDLGYVQTGLSLNELRSRYASKCA